MRTAGVASVTVAVTLIALKLWAWRASGSVALLGSLADSMLDLVASVITLLAVQVALTPADREHRFGHGKSEGIAGLVQSLIIGASALYVGYEAVMRLIEPEPIEAPAVAITALAISLVLTLGLFAFQRYVIARTGSLAIGADSVHYQADLLTNIALLVGLFVSYRFGWYWLDPVLGLFVAAVILWSVRAIVMESLDVLLDRELPRGSRREIEAIARHHPGVLGYHDVRTRSSGSAEFIQLHLEVDPQLTVLEAHRIAEEVERKVHAAFPRAEVLIHIDPHGMSEPKDRF